MRFCERCGKPLVKKPHEWDARFAARRFCDLVCSNRGRPINPKTTRYRYVRRGRKNVAVHRVVAEEKLGRLLAPDEVAHHVNGDKLDNRPENIVVMTKSEHSRLHQPQQLPSKKRCVVCGQTTTPHPTKRRRQKTCLEPSCVTAAIRQSLQVR